MLHIKIHNEDVIRKIAALAVAGKTTVHIVAEKYLVEALAAVPVPTKPLPPMPGAMTRQKAVDRNANTVLLLLKDNPAGLTVRAVERSTGWSHPTAVNVLRYMIDEQLADRRLVDTGAAPAWSYFLPSGEATP